ncbi:putative ribonuclease H-like domain-containing protein [Tanacetum coccineum]
MAKELLGYTQEERVDYDEVFAPVARIEVIRVFLAYASFKDFVVYQMDVKSAFLYGKIEEEVYVCQTLGFQDPEFPNRVYKVEKALYGLHQAHSASREVFLLTLVCGSRDALPSLVVPLVHLSLPLVSLFFQPRTYNLSTLPFRDSVQIVENDLVVKKFPENDLDVKKFPKNDFEMACVFPRSHGGDAGGSPPRRPNRPVPAQCESSNLRIETGNASLRRAFRQNDQRPLTIGFDYGDLGTFHPTGDYASMLNSLMGETVRYLPLACEWEEIPEAYKAHIFPTLELDMKSMQDQVRAGVIPYKTDQDILDEVELESDNEAKRSRGRVVKEANRGGAATGLFGCIEG